ncbi:MAG TPA: polysaccharide deacetylase family protein, partial [Candidatus Cloacimonadota bacterium]|nr:polysaccharide deacetylase family protein [Candidatus Cloacimonadota bacterium]
MKHIFAATHRIFYYHQIGKPQESFYPMGLSTEEFEQQIRTLKRLGYRFLTLREAYADSGRNRGLTATITTDDGFSCNYSEIYPLLKRLGIPFTMFVIGKCLDNQALAWNHKLLIIRQQADPQALHQSLLKLEARFHLKLVPDLSASLFSVPMSLKEELSDTLWEQFCDISQAEYLHKHQPFLSSDQLREMVASGCEIGTHSFSHPDFSRLTFPEILNELRASRALLEELYPVEFCAFPYGRQPARDLIPHICRQGGLSATLGGRYTWHDNRRPNYL